MPQKISTGMKEILTAPAYSTVKSGMMNLYVEDHHVKTHTAVKWSVDDHQLLSVKKLMKN